MNANERFSEKIFLYRGIIDLPYCVCFRCTKRWFTVGINCKAVTTRRLVPIPGSCPPSLPSIFFFFFFEMFTFNFYSLGNFHIQAPIFLTITSQWLVLKRGVCTFAFTVLVIPSQAGPPRTLHKVILRSRGRIRGTCSLNTEQLSKRAEWPSSSVKRSDASSGERPRD